MDTEEVPENKDPEIVGAVFQTALGILQLYGWIIVLVIIAVLYLRSKVQPWLYERSKQSDINSYKKMDSGTVQARLEAMEKARLKLQAQHDKEAKAYAELQKKKEEEKRRKRLEDLERLQQGKGPVNKARKAPSDLPTATASKKTSQPKKPLKPGYNPLMGEGSGGACYRPSRRGGASGGGG